MTSSDSLPSLRSSTSRAMRQDAHDTLESSNYQPRKHTGILSKLFHSQLIRHYIKLIIPLIIAAPFFLNLFPINSSSEKGTPRTISNCAGILIVVASYWVLECLPMAVTSFLPALLFPLCGILSSDDITSAYSNNLIALFIASYIVALGLERWLVHRRFALWVLCKIGTDRPRMVLAAFMLLSWLMSQWLSNTCTAAMLVPMAHTICESLCHIEKRRLQAFETVIEDDTPQDPSETPHLHHDVRVLSNASQKNFTGFIKQMLCFCFTSRTPSHLRRLRATERFSKAILLGIAHSCSIGGTSTLVGTATNLMFASQVRALFPKYGDVNFAVWMLFATPLSFILLMTLYVWLLIFFVRGYGWRNTATNGDLDLYMESGSTPEDGISHNSPVEEFAVARTEDADFVGDDLAKAPLLASRERTSSNDLSINSPQQSDKSIGATVQSAHPQVPLNDANAILQRELASLGPIRIEEILVMLLFLILCILWITRDMSFFSTDSKSGAPIGWSTLFYWITGKKYVSDATCAIMVCLALFVIPARTNGAQGDTQKTSTQKLHFLMDWQWVREKLPWRIVLLLGAGFALSEGLEKGGFSEQIGGLLGSLGERIPIVAFLFLLCTTVTMLTEFSSNVATCSLLMPILAHLSRELGENPLLLMVPAALCCSFAFMLPISTPPNAIAYSFGFITMRDMVSFGIVLNFTALVIAVLYTLGVGRFVLGIHLGELPEWAT